ncbi:MAG TPA: hypothetical protein VF796_30965 [Humisphaera sp.]
MLRLSLGASLVAGLLWLTTQRVSVGGLYTDARQQRTVAAGVRGGKAFLVHIDDDTRSLFPSHADVSAEEISDNDGDVLWWWANPFEALEFAGLTVKWAGSGSVRVVQVGVPLWMAAIAFGAWPAWRRWKHHGRPESAAPRGFDIEPPAPRA